MRTISIYSITHRYSGKRYIGKSINTEDRWCAHRCYMRNPAFDRKKVNRHLWNDAQKYGLDSFDFETIEVFKTVDDSLLADRELFWMDYFQSCVRAHGYNLRRDSSSVSTVHPETIEILRKISKGESNGNYGKRWSDSQKESMRLSRLERAAIYQTEEYRRKQSINSTIRWKDKNALREMSEKVRRHLLKYYFLQMNEDFSLIRIWSDMRTLVEQTGFKKQCVYSVCDGYKERYKGFRWVKIRREVLNTIFVVTP